MTFADPLNVFVAHGHVDVAGSPDGPLAGLSFALKDLFDLAGVPTGAGSPAWLASHPVPTANAPVVDMLLAAGARLHGKTHTDELAWSLNGENFYYGTPTNPAAPGRIPGGSSSGSAAATAGRLVDFAIGSDTGGSVRIPSSYCGLYGLRPTHGRIPIEGAVPLAPSFDCVGWFARDPTTFAKVGSVLLKPTSPRPGKRRLLIAEDIFATAGPAVVAALKAGVARVEAVHGAAHPVQVAPDGLAAWYNIFRLVQFDDATRAHQAWLSAADREISPGLRGRFAAAAAQDPADVKAALARRAEIRRHMDDLLGDDGLLLLPTAPDIAPLRGRPTAETEAYRIRALSMLCPAGLAGLPQISMPLGTMHECPIGLSAMAPRNDDEALVTLIQAI